MDKDINLFLTSRERMAQAVELMEETLASERKKREQRLAESTKALPADRIQFQSSWLVADPARGCRTRFSWLASFTGLGQFEPSRLSFSMSLGCIVALRRTGGFEVIQSQPLVPPPGQGCGQREPQAWRTFLNRISSLKVQPPSNRSSWSSFSNQRTE